MIFTILEFINCITINELKEWTKNLQNPSYLCHNNSDNLGTKIIEVKDCNDANAISTYDFKVILFIFYFEE